MAEKVMKKTSPFIHFRLFNKQKQFEDAMDTISLRDQEIEEMRNTMRNMEEDLKNNEHEIERYIYIYLWNTYFKGF